MIGVMKALGARNNIIRHTFLWFAVFIIGKGMILGNIRKSGTSVGQVKVILGQVRSILGQVSRRYFLPGWWTLKIQPTFKTGDQTI